MTSPGGRAHEANAPDGHTAVWWSNYRGGVVVEVEHTATGIRGRGTARTIAAARIDALKLCRVRMAMARRARHPLRLVRDLDVTAPDGAPLVVPQSALDAMLDATAPDGELTATPRGAKLGA